MTAGAVGARQEPDSTTGCDATDASKPANLAVRVLLELCAPATLGVLGARTRTRLPRKVALGVGAPCPCRRIDVRTDVRRDADSVGRKRTPLVNQGRALRPLNLASPLSLSASEASKHMRDLLKPSVWAWEELNLRPLPCQIQRATTLRACRTTPLATCRWPG